MSVREALVIPNLLSLSRILLAAVAVYYLRMPETWAVWAACAVVVLAGITDGLDGYLARRSDRVTALGTALDPLADKIFALILVVGLILFRDFPLWLAILIVGRDLLITCGGTYLIRQQPNLILPSNLTGKWAFASVVALLAAHIIRFNFSIEFMTPVVTFLLIGSLIVYARLFVHITREGSTKAFVDRRVYRIMRAVLATAVILIHLVMFWREFLS